MKRAVTIAVIAGLGWMAGARTIAQGPPAGPTTTALHTAKEIPADQQPTKEQLDKLFEVMRVKEQLASTTQIVPELVKQQFEEELRELERDNPAMSSANAEQRQALQNMMEKFAERATSLYTADEMIADMGALYQKHLSRTDLDAMIAFYSSPAGQHMVDTVPVIMKEYMPMVIRKTQERMKPLLVEMSKEAADIAKGGPADKPEQK